MTLPFLTRRRFLHRAGAAAAAALSAAGCGPSADPHTLRIFVYAGGHERTMRDAFVPAFEKQTGAKVVLDAGWWDAIAKLKASPKGKPAFDLLITDATQGYPAVREGLFGKINLDNIPNHKNLTPAVLDNWVFREGHGVTFPDSVMTLAYRPDLIGFTPSRWDDLLRDDVRGKIALYDSFYMSLYTFAAMKVAQAGKPGTAHAAVERDLDGVLAFAKENRDRVAFWWPTSTDMLTGLAHKDCALGNMRPEGAAREQRVEEMLDRVALAPAERGRPPAHLSGGQQQRVALARALVIEPKLLLLDEPFANLDHRLREQLRSELRALQRRTGVTTLLVTHDQEEALSLSDRAGVMARGRLLQVDAPPTLYHRPRNPFIARFLGDANLLTVADVGDGLLRMEGGWSLPWHGESLSAGDLLMLRPEQCVVGPAAAARQHRLLGRIVACSFLGADVTATVALTEQASLRVRCRVDGGAFFRPDEPVQVGFDEAALWRIPEADPGWLCSTSLPDAP